MKFKKPKFWNNINFLSICLLPFSLITLIFNHLKSHFTTRYKFKIPIICVGNVFIGGTGKTPLSIYIYNLLKKNPENTSSKKRKFKRRKVTEDFKNTNE